MNFKHYILTRFNINISFLNNKFPFKDPNNPPNMRILDEDYLEERFNLFEKYTLPSIKKQSNQNFKWIILFHKRTPNKFLNRIKELKKVYNFVDLYLDDHDSFNFSDYCKKHEDISDMYITTRLDNDDIIDEDFCYKIQKYANENLHECFLSFPYGAKLDLNFSKQFDINYKFNHFISMIGSNENTILNFNHAAIDKIGKEIVYLKTKRPMWIEIIHQSNVINEIKDYEVNSSQSINDDNSENDSAIYQLINLKIKLNREHKSYVDENTSIGDYTYGKPIIHKCHGVNVNIGKFCSIENNVSFF